MYTIEHSTTNTYGALTANTHELAVSDAHQTPTTKGKTLITALCHNNAISSASSNHDALQKPALIFVAGMFTSRKFWLSDNGIGLAAHLHSKGYDCFLIDRRGIGACTKAQPNITYDNFWQHDLPALQQFVIDQGFAKAYWIGHSFGGVAAILSLAKQHLDPDAIVGFATFSSQLTIGKRPLNPPISWITTPILKALGYLPAKLAGLGPEDESAGVILDLYQLVSWAKGRRSKHKTDFWHGFSDICAPILSFASVGDTVDPHKGCKIYHNALGSTHKQFILLGKSFGHIMNYSHAGMVISKPAQEEIWPKLEAWLQEQSV